MKICVFGAASTKIDPAYIEKVEALGRKMAERGHDLVFGAGGNGLMGAAARGMRQAGKGHITGVIPSFFRDETIEAIFDDCDELIFTDTMRERKAKMEDLADAFLVVPGGIGTFEELFEVMTLKQLGRFDKPIASYNLMNYYDEMENVLFRAINKRFIRANCRMLYLMSTDQEELLDYIEHSRPLGMDVHQLKDG